MPTRYFTLDEAQALIPRLTEWLGLARRSLTELREVAERMRADRSPELAREMVRLRREIETILREIDEHGVEVKGIDEGLCDFRALRAGEVVYLCWKLGEPRIAWWHPLESGFAGRQPVDPADPEWAVWN